MSIRIVKLISGEEVLGELSEFEFEGKKLLRLRHPVSLMYRESEDKTKFSVGMAPFAIASKDHIIPIFPGQIVSIYDPTDAIVKRWVHKYGNPEALVTYEEGEEPVVPQFLQEATEKNEDTVKCTNIDATSYE